VPAAQAGVDDLIKASDTPDGPYSGYPTFSGPPQVVSALDATGDACSTVSNRTFDQLDEGGANAAWGGGVSVVVTAGG
jgi:hypothetical protein